MCEGHWHRVPVLDEVRKLVGMISTMDLLAAMVQAHDEPAGSTEA
jgi:CBS-domain-containing membrane protein